MSYILDALRRAESERERGTVPRLHTQSEATLSTEQGPHSPRARRLRLGLVLGLLLGLIALVLAWVFGLGQGPWRSAERPPAQAASLSVAPMPVVAVAVVKNPVVPQQTTPAKPAESANPVARPITAPSGPLAAVPPAMLSAVPPAVPANTPPAVAAKPAAIPALSALPESLRRELPPLVAGGAMYSDTPANRMLIINGQVLREGDQVAPQLVLEQIKLKAAVLVYKGERFSINF
ncbi:general secretion pathway protein GspB [Roseateles koreensis]|uniref:General secretion pathway protein GspB n=1 Tax=Roseateles koreensis TaxID=2987526 RepID=A0ABT5KS54_9BURK|nr:general secretion pathway protein GspB [Roseateles koreensis]MDC8785754.1 general secretion pathway protein GspB [Roseateles koreensis]